MSRIHLKTSATEPVAPNSGYGLLWVDATDGLLKQKDSSGNVISAYPILLTAGQIGSPSAPVLANTYVTYQLNVAPYTRYRSNGTTLVELGSGSGGGFSGATLDIDVGATPSNPVAGKVRLFVDSTDGLLKQKDESGNVETAFPIALTAGQISSPSAPVLANIYATYQLNVAPYTRYRSNGTTLVEFGAQGPQGIQGVQGIQGIQGPEGPAAPLTPTVETVTGTSYTLQASDEGKIKRFTNAGAITVTVPTAFSGKAVTLSWQTSTGTITVTPSGTTINGSSSSITLSSSGGAVSLMPNGTANQFDLYGAAGDLVVSDISDSGAMGRSIVQAATNTDVRALIGSPAVSQTFYMSFSVPTVADGDVVKVPMEFAGAITKVTAQSDSGTCTLTTKVNSTAITGTAVSVSSTRSSQTHSSGNTFTSSDSLVFTVSGNSSCLGMRVTVSFTRTLGA